MPGRRRKKGGIIRVSSRISSMENERRRENEIRLLYFV